MQPENLPRNRLAQHFITSKYCEVFMIIYGLDNAERIKRMKWKASTVDGKVIIVMSIDDIAFRVAIEKYRTSIRKVRQIIIKMQNMY